MILLFALFAHTFVWQMQNAADSTYLSKALWK